MANADITQTWITLELGENGFDRVLNIGTDLILNPQETGYDEARESALMATAKAMFESDGKADRLVIHGRERKS